MHQIRLETLTIFLIAFHLVSCITITSNGNTPERKMLTLNAKDIEFGGFVPIRSNRYQRNYIDEQKRYLNSTVLPVNERYRRLIPYMTFYLANDFNDPQNELLSSKVPVQKIAIPVSILPRVQSTKTQYANVPHYQGNRISQFNIASAYPDKIVNDYKPQQNSIHYDSNYDTYSSVQSIMRAPPKQEAPISYQTPIPVPVKVSNLYNTPDISALQYYTKPSQERPKYKWVPYEQSPPVQVPEFNDDYFVPKVYESRKPIPVPVALNNEQNYQTPQPSYQEKEYTYRPLIENALPTTETGFRPIVGPTFIPTTQYPSTFKKPQNIYKIHTTRKPPVKIEENHIPELNYGPSSSDQFEQNNLANILKNLQTTNSLPQTITADNIDSSIKTLVKILSNYQAPKPTYTELSTIRPKLSSPVPFRTTAKPLTNAHAKTIVPHFHTPSKSLHLQKVHEYPPQDLELDHVVEPVYLHGVGTSQNFPSEQDELGGTPGRPGIDYPTLSLIPQTSFDCKTQRYKGFFGDPETHCQVWHYCDLNGGQASFLCPNGTIFSQVALTCDWWFNVKCSTTTQLYVLNERLYKYILPYSPKFPEDYSGPLVDKYLAIKYKEMEEKMKKKKKVSKQETSLETEKVDVIEIKTSGMSGALRPYEHQK